MSYHKKHRGKLRALALGGAADCGPDQQWDPNATFPGLPPGQCTPKGSPMTPAPEKSAVTSFFEALVAPSPVVRAGTTYVPTASTGISTTTLALAGGAALLLILLAARR